MPIVIDLPLTTERLDLRPFEQGDFDVLVEIQSRPEVARYLYWEPRGPDEVRQVLERKIAHRSLEQEGDVLELAVVDRATRDMVGDVVLMWRSAEHRQGEVGYTLHPRHQGHGYATESARRMLQLGFEQLGLHRIVGRLEPRNTASARVLERLGMRREAHLLENEWVKDEWQSEQVYAMLDREWQALRA